MNLIIIALLIGLGVYLIFQKQKGQSWKKILGSLFLVGGFILIEPSPDPISLGAYCISHGLELSSINASNIASLLVKFEIWSISIGIIFVLMAMHLLGWNFKKVWKKLDIGKYKVALIVAFLSVLAVSLMNIWSANVQMFNFLINLSWVGVLMIFAIPALLYYFWVHKDKSEALGIFVFSNILYFGGLKHLSYYLFKGLSIPTELPNLIGSPFINFVSTKLLGYSTVTNVGLLVSVFISFVVAFIVAKILKEKF